MHEDRIHSEYRRMEAEALEKWRSHPSEGNPVDFPYDRSLLAIAMGQYFEPCQVLSSLLTELREIARHDTTVEVPDPSWLHMTFLALSPHLYTDGNYPNELSIVTDVYDRYAPYLNWVVRDVCLLPTSNALLLAGFPDEDSINLRGIMADEILDSAWNPLITKRYAGFPIPPHIWHTTLMRSHHEFLPEAVRRVYSANRCNTFAAIHLGQPVLAGVTYNWSRIEIIRRAKNE